MKGAEAKERERASCSRSCLRADQEHKKLNECDICAVQVFSLFRMSNLGSMKLCAVLHAVRLQRSRFLHIYAYVIYIHAYFL